MRRVVFAGCLLACVAVAAFSAPAHAEPSAKKVLVPEFTGAKKKALREKFVSALTAAGFEVVDDGKLGATSSAADIEAHAADAGADAVVMGEGVLKKAGWKLVLSVYSAEDGSAVDTVEIAAPWLPKLLGRIDATAAASLADPIERAAPKAPEPEPEPEPADTKPAASDADRDDPADEAPAEAPERDGARPSPVDLGAGVRGFRRDFQYNQDVNGNLRGYEFPRAPSVFVRAVWYPGAHFTSGFASHLGIAGGYEQSFATSSQLESGGPSYGTTLRAWYAGARLRLPFSRHEGGVGLRYGEQSFTVDGDRDASAVSAAGAPVDRDFLPDVAYKYVRLGGDVRFAFGPVTVGAAAGFRYVTSAGAIQSSVWFPNAEILAGDAEIFGGYSLTDSLLWLGGVGVQRYGLDMKSRPADLDAGRDVAGGAVDQYLSIFTAIEWRPGERPAPVELAGKRRTEVAKR